MANRPVKSCPASLVIREIYIKITTRYHFVPPKIVKIKKILIAPNFGEHWKKN